MRRGANAAMVVESDGERRGIEIFARKGAPAIAVNDGRIVRVGKSKRLGRFVKLLDVYGNTYTYARLGKVAKTYPAPKKRVAKRDRVRRELELAEGRRRAPPRRVGDAQARVAARRAAAAAAGPSSGWPPTPRSPRRRPPRSRSACSPTPRGRTPASPAAPPSSARPPRRPRWPRSASARRTS